MSNQDLTMSFDPHTIQHLGIKMYSKLPNAIAEIIANSYDADATKVAIYLNDSNPDSKEIIIEDDGNGMDFKDINDKFLRIGRNCREEGIKLSPKFKRVITGKKGLGKLAFFGICQTVEITTTKEKSDTSHNFILDWVELNNTHSQDYKPEYNTEKCNKKEHGTKVRLTKLHNNNFNPDNIAISLSNLFQLFGHNFEVKLYYNGKNPIKIDNQLKYSRITPQFIWKYSSLKPHKTDYNYSKNINGEIYSTEKPLRPGNRGITLFANGRMVNTPEFFGVSESSHAYSYLTGWFEIDFVDNWKEDVISTARQSLNWDTTPTEELRDYLKGLMSNLERDWRQKRKESKRNQIKEKTKIDVDAWYNTIPNEILSKVENIVNILSEDGPVDEATATSGIDDLQYLIPPYTYYHWRHLHSKIHEVAQKDYEHKDYLRAAREAVVYFNNEVKKIYFEHGGDNIKMDGQPLMGFMFGKDGKLKITGAKTETEQNIEEGIKFLSMGVLTGFRNPASHEIKPTIYPKIFNDKDCLDILSLISYLFGKLDQTK